MSTTVAEESAKRTYTIDIENQVNDSLLSSEDIINYFKGIMKVRNSKVIAERCIDFKNHTTSVDVVSEKRNIIKKNMKLYIKRFLRSKALKDFIKVRGDNADGFSLEYINKVDEAEE